MTGFWVWPPNPEGWRCRGRNENPSKLDVGSAAEGIIGFDAVDDSYRPIAGIETCDLPSPYRPFKTACLGQLSGDDSVNPATRVRPRAVGRRVHTIAVIELKQKSAAVIVYVIRF